MRGFLLVLVLLAAALTHAASGHGQQSGHSTVPTSGPADPGGFATAARAEDPVLVSIEQLRRDLADLAKAYRKTKEPERTRRQPDLLAALRKAEAEVATAREAITPR